MTPDIPPVKFNSNIVLIWSIQLVFDFLAVCSRFLSAKLNPLYSSILTDEKFKIEYLNTWHTYVMTAVEINLKCFDHRSAFNKCKWTMVSQAHNAPQLSVRFQLPYKPYVTGHAFYASVTLKTPSCPITTFFSEIYRGNYSWTSLYRLYLTNSYIRRKIGQFLNNFMRLDSIHIYSDSCCANYFILGDAKQHHLTIL